MSVECNQVDARSHFSPWRVDANRYLFHDYKARLFEFVADCILEVFALLPVGADVQAQGIDIV